MVAETRFGVVAVDDRDIGVDDGDSGPPSTKVVR